MTSETSRLVEGGEKAKSVLHGGLALSAVGHGCTRKSLGVNAGTRGPSVAPGKSFS